MNRSPETAVTSFLVDTALAICQNRPPELVIDTVLPEQYIWSYGVPDVSFDARIIHTRTDAKGNEKTSKPAISLQSLLYRSYDEEMDLCVYSDNGTPHKKPIPLRDDYAWWFVEKVGKYLEESPAYQSSPLLVVYKGLVVARNHLRSQQ